MKHIQNQFWDHGGKTSPWIKFQWPRSCLSLCKSPTNSARRNSTLFFGCNPSVAEYFSMGHTPWTLKIPKLGPNEFPRGKISSGTWSGKKSCQHEPGSFYVRCLPQSRGLPTSFYNLTISVHPPIHPSARVCGGTVICTVSSSCRIGW